VGVLAASGGRRQQHGAGHVSEIYQKSYKLLSNSFIFDLCILANLVFDGPNLTFFIGTMAWQF
jgi:hypothetical protein